MPLTRKQLEHLEQRLLAERVRSEELINGIATERSAGTEFAQSGDSSLMPFHPADRGTDTSDEDLSLSNATRASAELAEMDAALDRLRKSPATFGRCENTAREIPFERLDIIPWARTCE